MANSNRTTDQLANLQKKAAKKQNVEDLKQEVNIDDHKITIEELCARFKTNVDKGLTAALAKEYLERDGCVFINSDGHFN